MTKETMMEMIYAQNRIVESLRNCKATLPADQALSGMAVWHSLSTLGYKLTHEARAMGIDVKCDMQSGEILFQ